MKIRTIFLSWDFLVSLLVGVMAYVLLPRWIPNELASEFYSIGVSVVSIVFAVYFAALAIMISSGDDKFIAFMEEDGTYTELIRSFQFTLGLLFVSLLYSIGAYTASMIWKECGHEGQFAWVSALFAFLFLYGLFASLLATIDCIRYAERRVKFLMLISGTEKGGASEQQDGSESTQ